MSVKPEPAKIPRPKQDYKELVLTIDPITHENAEIYRAIRLRALEEAPYAFSSAYASESKFSPAEWFARVERMNGNKAAGFLAMDGENACGLVGCFLNQSDPSIAQLVSMWTDPEYRRQNVGRLLVGAAIRWANERKVKTLKLLVTSNNEGAMHFYDRLNFTRTGRTEPYPNDPLVTEYEMERAIP